MPTYTYGHSSNDFVEIPDPAVANQTIRPAPGLPVAVRDAYSLATFPDVESGLYGYLSFTSTAPAVQVSTDGFQTWKELYGEEAVRGAIAAGVDATQAAQDASTALTNVNALATRVQTLEAGGGSTTGGGSTFSGTVDWATQVTGKPSLTASALGFLPATARGAAQGVAPLVDNVVPVGNLPVGTTAQQVASGSHVHSTSWASMPAGTVCRVFETAPGVYPAPATTRADIGRIFYGVIRPTTAQGLQANDEWRNTGAA